MKTNTVLRTGASALLALFLATLPSTAFAGGNSPPTGNSPGARGDDVGTAPRMAANSAPGFVLQVDAARLEDVLGNTRGSGTVKVRRNIDGSFTLTFSGKQVIRLDRQAVATGEIQVRYVGPRKKGRVIQHKGSLFLIQR